MIDKINRKLDTDSQIFFYEQEFYVLSNFSAFTLIWNGIRFDTSEAAYHWEKFLHSPIVKEMILRAPSAHEAFKISRRYEKEKLKNWDILKIPTMKAILYAKVTQHEYVYKKLIQSGDRELIEDSWRDDFWGWGPYKNGQNMLGKLWMEIREEIKGRQNG